jgi:hypothetical protein
MAGPLNAGSLGTFGEGNLLVWGPARGQVRVLSQLLRSAAFCSWRAEGHFVRVSSNAGMFSALIDGVIGHVEKA